MNSGLSGWRLRSSVLNSERCCAKGCQKAPCRNGAEAPFRQVIVCSLVSEGDRQLLSMGEEDVWSQGYS